MTNASGLSAGAQYMGAVPALVTEAMSKVAYTYVHLSNMNSLMGAFEANKQLEASSDEADKQRQEGWSNAIGQIALGVTQIAAGGVQMGGAILGYQVFLKKKIWRVKLRTQQPIKRL
jgi:DNA-binding IclR family transcriptional regulator